MNKEKNIWILITCFLTLLWGIAFVKLPPYDIYDWILDIFLLLTILYMWLVVMCVNWENQNEL